MADKIAPAGRLISVDGSRGKDVNAAASAIARALRDAAIECAVSRWDASGLFDKMAEAARNDQRVSARTLSLVFAADLAFRLRWEIRPMLEAGATVIAATYIESAVAFGVSCGLTDKRLTELMRFAPAPNRRGRVKERKINRPWKRRADRGYGEFAAMALADSPARKVSKRTRHDMIRRLDELRGRGTFPLTQKGIAAIVKAATGSRPAGARRSA